MKPMPTNRPFYCRTKYINQENYYRAIEGKSHEHFQSCILFLYKGSIFCDNFILHCLSYNSVHRHEHHFVVINKGARQFNLKSATRYCTIQITFS